MKIEKYLDIDDQDLQSLWNTQHFYIWRDPASQLHQAFLKYMSFLLLQK